MIDYLKEFGDEYEGEPAHEEWWNEPIKPFQPHQPKKLPITFQPQNNFEVKPRQDTIDSDQIKKINIPSQKSAEEDQTSFPSEGITENNLKEMVQSAVLHMMNAPSIEKYELLENQKEEIENIIAEYWDRPGVMSICFHENYEKDEACIGMLVDPTNTQNWVFIKEEVIYKLPYLYKNSLHSFASQVWKKKGRLLEVNLPNTEQIELLKSQIAAANKEANDRYNEVAHHTTHYMSSNPFQRFSSSTPDAQQGHRDALADGQYRALKKRAIDLETQLRRLQKRLKK